MEHITLAKLNFTYTGGHLKEHVKYTVEEGSEEYSDRGLRRHTQDLIEDLVETGNKRDVPAVHSYHFIKHPHLLENNRTQTYLATQVGCYGLLGSRIEIHTRTCVTGSTEPT